MAKLKKVVTIAGSDTSGGAGIQADLKTFQERGVYGMNVLTVIVSMGPNWEHRVFPVDMNIIKEQADTVFKGIGVDGVKTGMLPTVEIIEYAGSLIKDMEDIPVVIDPVMVCKGVKEALFPENTVAMRKFLLPYATITTPNLFEASQLADVEPIGTIDELKDAAKKIFDLGVRNVVIKGGKSFSDTAAIDILYDGRGFELFEAEKIDTPYTHGAGCSFAACITAELAKGAPVSEAVSKAKELITEALRQSFKLNEFVGPLNHKAFALK
mgnify:FL=1